MREQQQERAARQQLSGKLLGILRGYIGSLSPSTLLEALPKSEPSPRNGETVLGAIARLRGELAAAQCELMQLRAATLPLDDLKEMATRVETRNAIIAGAGWEARHRLAKGPGRLPRLGQCRTGYRSPA